jgi:hypothetical protein
MVILAGGPAPTAVAVGNDVLVCSITAAGWRHGPLDKGCPQCGAADGSRIDRAAAEAGPELLPS